MPNFSNSYFTALVKGISSQMDIHVRWCGDWDSNSDLKDQTTFDLPYFEIRMNEQHNRK